MSPNSATLTIYSDDIRSTFFTSSCASICCQEKVGLTFEIIVCFFCFVSVCLVVFFCLLLLLVFVLFYLCFLIDCFLLLFFCVFVCFVCSLSFQLCESNRLK